MSKPNVSVVIPNWNGEDFLAACIDSLLKQSQKCEIVVVENGSVDRSDEILAGYGDKITVLKQPKNLGFAGGVNVGIRYAIEHDHEYVALFNNDAVADEGWLQNLVNRADSAPNCGIISCKFMHMDKRRLDSTGDFYTIYGLPYPRGRHEVDTGQYDDLQDVFGASGGASLYRVAMFKDIGLFDEDFFAYYEDVDLSFRAQLGGWKILYEPKAIAYHHISGTGGKISGFGTYQTARNFWFIYLKNMPGILFWKYLPLASYWYFRMFAARFIRGGLKPYVKGYLASFRYIPKKLKERSAIQHNRKVTVKYVDSILIHDRAPKPPKA